MTDEMFYKLSAQVQALEAIVQTMIAMQLASKVSQEADFAKAAITAEELRDHLTRHFDDLEGRAPANAVQSGVASTMMDEMRRTVARCMDGASAQLRQVGALVLEVAKPPSDAKN